MTAPIVLVTSCNHRFGEHPFHIAGRKYVDAVRLAGALPLIAPPFDVAELDSLLDVADGVLLTGSPSNVHPSHFGEDVLNPALPLDPERDAWTLPLIRRALARGVPLLAICRGTQEANVALGGSLHQAVQDVKGLNDHRSREGAPAAEQYGPAHPVDVVPGGLLAGIVGSAAITVNSVHGQGIKALAPGLRVEALAPDGLVEAFSQPAAPGFNLCLQWHPEWQAAGNPVSMQILHAFGNAVRGYRDRVRGPLPACPVTS
ncbi:MAG: gamma-glutamyl-gamma-aminobutyrate hydrolase family protein [Rubrivivax sp.]|nr:gamma-glutamyl-gamma-aminobutyrate hydrolase family protein [Rubrivivax sp.]